MLSQDEVIAVLESFVTVKVDPRERDADRDAFQHKTTRYVPEVALLAPDGKRLGTLKSRDVTGVVRELESVIALYRAENGRARGLDPRTIRAFEGEIDLGIEVVKQDDVDIKPLRTPQEYDDERRMLQDRFQAVRSRFNEEAIAW